MFSSSNIVSIMMVLRKNWNVLKPRLEFWRRN
ncbi:hypothetical protein NC652_036102 [Populus alba x Populus x berolinensis]|nr:hypothetical protein NC652_036102 [Populus alba x Populus x berolinensis]